MVALALKMGVHTMTGKRKRTTGGQRSWHATIHVVVKCCGSDRWALFPGVNKVAGVAHVWRFIFTMTGMLGLLILSCFFFFFFYFGRDVSFWIPNILYLGQPSLPLVQARKQGPESTVMGKVSWL